MGLKLKDNRISFDLSRKNNKYRLYMKIESEYFNYDIYSKIKYEEIIDIIERIERIIFCRYGIVERIEIGKISFEFFRNDTNIKLSIRSEKNSEYSVFLNREAVLDLYHYLTKCVNTIDKLNVDLFKRQYTYIEVRYIDVYSERKYSYISEDKSIRVGDIVYVDRAGEKCLAIVVSKNKYYFEQTPYPVLETKRVIKIVTRAEKYKK